LRLDRVGRTSEQTDLQLYLDSLLLLPLLLLLLLLLLALLLLP
jgi:hypothetical protein